MSGDGNTVVLLPHFRALAIVLLPALASLNGMAVTPEERSAAEEAWRRQQRLYRLARGSLASSVAPLTCQLAMGMSPPPPAAAAAGAEPVPDLARRFVGRVLNHSLAIDEKITQLNELWPEIVRKYEARVREEIDDPELFRQRYETLIYGPH